MTTIEALAQAVARMIPDRKPVKLAREAITYVGGSLPGGARAIGTWDGGTERATVLRIPAEQAQQIAVAAATRNRQKTAVWFTPGEGPDSLHVLSAPGSPAALRKGLNKHGVTYLTLIPHGGRTTVHVVDQGSELTGPMQAYAAESGAKLVTHPGRAGYSRTKLSRVKETNGEREYEHDPTNPTYMPVNFSGRVMAVEPMWHARDKHWFWGPAVKAEAQEWLRANGHFNAPNGLPDAKAVMGSKLTEGQLTLAGLTGSPEEREQDYRPEHMLPEDFYAA